MSAGLKAKPGALAESVTDESVELKDDSEVRSNSKKFHRSPSWQELSPEPYFNIGLIINSTCIRDAHVSAINKPASRCQLTSVVVLHPDVEEPNSDSSSSIHDSVRTWLQYNKVSADVNHLDFVGTGQSGCDEMLRSSSIHAVYIIVPPRYVVGCLLYDMHACC